jgi:hypothetical protein
VTVSLSYVFGVATIAAVAEIFRDDADRYVAMGYVRRRLP